MEVTTPTRLILAIESAIGGGSLSLLENDREVDSFTGSTPVSGAEELLVNINALLKTNDLRPQDLSLVAASAGPGSFTGIRVGIATALGLKNGLGIEMSCVPALRSMVHDFQGVGVVTAAVPVGRGAVCIQSFNKDQGSIVETSEPQVIDIESLGPLIQNTDGKFIVHGALFGNLSSSGSVVDAGLDIAVAIGRFCRDHSVSVSAPLFVRRTV